jgi:hypothetical protein
MKVNETPHRVADGDMLIYRAEHIITVIYSRDCSWPAQYGWWGAGQKNKRRSDFPTSENFQGQFKTAVSNITCYLTPARRDTSGVFARLISL